MNLKLPNHKPNRKLNRYLGFPPAKRANPIRFPIILGSHLSPTQKPVQPV